MVRGRNLRLMYVELHSCSAFSFLEGASLPEELAEAAANSGMPAIALLDRDGVYGSPRFHSAAKKCGINAHIGAEISISDLGDQAGFPSWMPNKLPPRPVRLSLLVKDRMGYQNLCRLITCYKLREKEQAPQLSRRLQSIRGALFVSPAGMKGYSRLRSLTAGMNKLARRSKSWLDYSENEMSTSNCSGISIPWKNSAIKPLSASRIVSICHFLLPTAFVMRSPKTGKFWTCSPASEIIANSARPGGCWKKTTNVTYVRHKR